MDWNQERVDELKKCWAEGYSSGMIAKAFGCTRNSVIGKIHRLELPSRERPKPQSPLPKTTRIRKSSTMKSPILPPEPFIERKAITPLNGTGLSLLALEQQHCRFIVGSSEDGAALYCGHNRAFGSYCVDHARLCFNQELFGKRDY